MFSENPPVENNADNFNQYGENMEKSLEDVIVSVANSSASEEELRTSIQEAFTASRTINAVITDTNSSLDLPTMQSEFINPIVAKYNLNPDEFSIEQLSELAKQSD